MLPRITRHVQFLTPGVDDQPPKKASPTDRIINVFHEYHGGATDGQVSVAIEAIPARLTEIFERSRRENRPTNVVADQLARARIEMGARRLVA